MVEISLTFFRLFGQDVAVVSVFSFDFAGTGEREAFLGSGIGLYLWHFVEKILVVCQSPRHWVPTVSVNFILSKPGLRRFREFRERLPCRRPELRGGELSPFWVCP